MRIFVISDIHGSSNDLNTFIKIFNEEQGDLLVILGDILSHGPRNMLPEGYDPKSVIETLNQYKSKILWIKGNCDAEVDEMVLDFQVSESGVLYYSNRRIYLTHGHKHNENNMNLCSNDILLYGHLHVNFLKEKDGVIIGNPGSISLPKENTQKSYMLIENNEIAIFNLKKEKIMNIKI